MSTSGLLFIDCERPRQELIIMADSEGIVRAKKSEEESKIQKSTEAPPAREIRKREKMSQ
jgi:hypothetical protein